MKMLMRLLMSLLDVCLTAGQDRNAPEALDSSGARSGLPIISLIFWATFRLLINRHQAMSKV